MDDADALTVAVAALRAGGVVVVPTDTVYGLAALPDMQRAVDRIYLAKDALTRAEHYRAMDPRLDAWESVRRKWDPHGTLRSAQSVRVFGDRP